MQRTLKDTANLYQITVTAELNWLKGNAKPYFSITASGKDHGSEFGGCCHDEILKHWPDLQPLVDLHLSDIDGIPMHALENGFYHLGGTNWQEAKFDVAARHFRISEQEARNLVGPKQALAVWIESQKPRWLAEANTAIEQFHLRVPEAAS
jgi:hypothetical protein